MAEEQKTYSPKEAPIGQWVIGDWRGYFLASDVPPHAVPSYRDARGDWWRAEPSRDEYCMPYLVACGPNGPHSWWPVT